MESSTKSQSARSKFNCLVFYLVFSAFDAVLDQPDGEPEPSTASPELNVFVRSFSGATWSFRVRGDTTIGNFKTIIQEKFPNKAPTDVTTWRLILSAGPFLSDNTSLISAGVLDNCTLFMKAPVYGGSSSICSDPLSSSSESEADLDEDWIHEHALATSSDDSGGDDHSEPESFEDTRHPPRASAAARAPLVQKTQN